MSKTIFSLLVLTIFHVTFSYSQDDGIRKRVEFSKGEIVSSTTSRLLDGTLYKANKVEDEAMIGVFSNFQSKRMDLSIITEGIAEVLYDNATPIKKGDFVTSSKEGKAVKFDGNGWVLGVALEDPTGDFLKIRVNVHYK